jgi:hypothetical protein
VELVSLLRPAQPKTVTVDQARKAMGIGKLEKRGRLLVPSAKTIGSKPDHATASKPKGKAAARAAGKRARASRRRNR